MDQFKGDWVQGLLHWYHASKRSFPWRTQVHVYHTWICEVMSQQTTLKVVLPKFAKFISVLPRLEQLATCSDETLRELWSGLGYYARARNLRAGARFILEQRQGRFPETAVEWREVPGCGPYTAAVIASICFHEKVACVDGNVVRVVSRLLALSNEAWTPEGQARIRQVVDAAIPNDAPGDFNQAMMELGATLCRKSSPDCFACPLKAVCQAYALDAVSSCPAKKPRREFIDEPVVSLILSDPLGEKFALVERTRGFLAKTKGFPLLKSHAPGTAAFLQSVSAWPGVEWLEPALTYRHTITHHKIAGRVCLARLPKALQSQVHNSQVLASLQAGQAEWTPRAQVSRALATSLDAKAWAAFEAWIAR